ncbi:MAG: carbamoyltransferase [Longimicrobiaceae bacterium]
MTTRADSPSHEPWVLGISASHNGGACILHGDRIVAAIQEERLSRFKRDRVYGARESLAVGYCLQAAGIRPTDLDLVVLCAQDSVSSDDYDLAFNRQLALVRGKVPWLTIPHHLGHAVHAFATSGFEDAAVLVVDGLGSPFEDLTPGEQALASDARDGWETISLYEASGTAITPLEKHMNADGNWLQPRREGMPRFRSLGGMYSAVASQLFGNPMEAGKVMGLAPYGSPAIAPGEFFTLTDGRFLFHDGVPARFDHHRRWPDCEREYRDLAASVQGALEVAIEHLVDRLSSLSASRRLCYSGGVALNCIANEKLIRGSRFRDVYIPPAAEDSGVAMGAAYYGLWHLTSRNTRRALRKDAVGRTYSRDEIDHAIRTTPGVKVTRCGEEVLGATVSRLCSGEFGGWFQGGSELGPRALGGRSIVADPRRPDAKDQLNGRVKHREAFQPFAPAILEDQAGDWFELDGTSVSSPFMLRVWPFKPAALDRVPAVVHVDGTGRVETVDREGDHPFHPLLERFERATGVPILLNTSFNGRGEPIVETPQDALWCMLETGLDFVVLEDRLVERDESTRSLLDLVPVLLAKQFTLDVIRRPEGLAETSPADTVLTVRVRTPWGIREERLPSTIHPLIAAIDGVTDGWALRERIGANTGRAPEPRQLAGALSQLRRSSVIDLRSPPSAGGPELEEAAT